MTTMKSIWFGALGLLYLLHAGLFFATDGFGTLLDFSIWRALQKVVLVTIPIYVGYLWKYRDEIIWLDYQLIYLPFVVWCIAFYFFGVEKGMSNMYVELQVVSLVNGIYLLRFPMSVGRRGSIALTIGACLLTAVSACAVLVALLLPPLPD